MNSAIIVIILYNVCGEHNIIVYRNIIQIKNFTSYFFITSIEIKTTQNERRNIENKEQLQSKNKF